MDTMILADGYWFQPETQPYIILAHPLFWVLFLAVWYVLFVSGTKNTPKIFPKFNRNTNRPGDFTKDGTTTKSEAEDRVRKDLELAGFSTMPQATALVVNAKFGQGDSVRKITPDIIIYAYRGKPMKMIVEYDGAKWHGGGGGTGGAVSYAKICDDAERNQRYAELGYTVVRVRAGSEFYYPEHDIEGNQIENYYSRITRENDIPLPEDYIAEKHRSIVMKTVMGAQYFPPQKWEPLVKALYPYVEQDKMQKQIQRNMQGGRLH